MTENSTCNNEQRPRLTISINFDSGVTSVCICGLKTFCGVMPIPLSSHHRHPPGFEKSTDRFLISLIEEKIANLSYRFAQTTRRPRDFHVDGAFHLILFHVTAAVGLR